VRSSLRLTLVAAALLAALPVLAVIPSSPKIAGAVAETNEGSGRGDALLLDVALSVGESEAKAIGVLASHPTGLARLELRSGRGFVERHLLQSNEYRASRDGALLDEFHPFLPPIFLLQASSGEALSAALKSFGVSEQEVVLGRAGDRDCYVFGGRIPGPPGEEQLLPSLWIDMNTYEPVRIVRDDGVEYRLGPPTLFDHIRVPTWIEIVEPSGLTARLEVKGVTPANAPAASFQMDWLTAPASSR
jgi:hypothetical protein